MKIMSLLFCIFLSNTISTATKNSPWIDPVCKGVIANEYKDYCASICTGVITEEYKSHCSISRKKEKIQSYRNNPTQVYLSKLSSELSFVDFKNSQRENTQVSDEEVESLYIKSRFLNQFDSLSKEEEELIYLIRLINKHRESIGLKSKRKYSNNLKTYIKSLNKATSSLNSGDSRKKSRIEPLLKKINKHVKAYGGEFALKAKNEEKRLILSYYKEKKQEDYRNALIRFEIESDIEGLDVYIDGDKKGKTPLVVNLEPRRHLVELKNKAFRLEEVINPKNEGFYYGNLSNSTWTSQRIASLNTQLKKDIQASKKFSTANLNETIGILKESKDFLSSYKKGNSEISVKLKDQLKALALNSEESSGSLGNQLNDYLLDVESLGELKSKLNEVERTNKNIRNKGLKKLFNKTSNILNKEKLVVFLDLDQEGLKVSNDTEATLISNKEVKKINEHKYLIYAKKISSEIDQNITSQKQIRGSFPSGTEQKFNPRYDRAVAKRDKAYRDYMEDKIEWEQNKETCARQSSSSRAFWCGVLLSPNNSEYNAAQAALERTPRIIDEIIYQDYFFKEIKIKAKKEVVFELGIIDLKKNKIYQKEIKEEKSKNLKMYSGLRDDDTKFNRYRGDSVRDLERFLETPYSLKLSYLERKIQDVKITKNSSNLKGRLTNFISSIDKESKLLKENTSQKLASDSSLLVDDRFYSVVKVIDMIDDSLGTGFYVSKNTIITNAHVVGKKRTIKIQNYKGEEFTGRIIKASEETDLALIKVSKKGPPVEFWNLPKIQAGASAEAIGHPEGLDFSITRGVVSALRKRTLEDFGKEIKLIQIDVPINHGNSGGPLFIGRKVIGVNTLGSDFQGLNFAIHYQEVLDFIK